MEPYFVIVSQVKDRGVINPILSGRLHSTTFSEAEIEAGEYRDFLNDGKRLDELKSEFYIVQAHSYEQIRGLPYFVLFFKNEINC